MVFDNDFSTVTSLVSESEPSSFWKTVDLEEKVLRIPRDDGSPAHLEKDWITSEELGKILVKNQTNSNFSRFTPIY